MEHPIMGWEWIPHSSIMDAEKELSDADFPEIRLFSVPLHPSPEPLKDFCKGEWELAGPRSLADFSASAWFFAKNLYQSLNIPIGIIHSSWGGTSILAWTNQAALEDFRDSLEIGDFSEVYDPNTWKTVVQESIENQRQRRIQMSYPRPEIKELVLDDSYDDSQWEEVDLAKDEYEHGYVVWLRKKFRVPEDRKTDFFLSLGFLNRQSHVYINGKELGYFQYPAPVKAKVPAGLLKPGENLITIRLSSQWGAARFHGDEDMFFLQDSHGTFFLPLHNGWKTRSELAPILPEKPSYANHPGFLFNGMVSPVIPYGIKGFIWDQGSADIGRVNMYSRLFKRLINDWRSFWGDDQLPFLFVQNTNTHTSHEFEKRSFGRSHLREAQARALELPHTGMVVSVDIGDPYDVHPKNKQEFGRRLALQALRKVYGKDITADGPFYQSHTVRGDTVVVSIKDNSHQFTELKHEGDDCGFELADEAGDFFPAKALLVGKEIYVRSGKVARPKMLRYAWGDNPKTCVFNGSGLPLAPFYVEINEDH
ncbi:sialate O-acetylesterase [Negadavirga shengliensis]|uniref:Sialate O-acetylesterase n=1 Tax=Negadavirga shengliensis TaxID=1389218 RepID=A0ABV9SXH0_9BACT